MKQAQKSKKLRGQTGLTNNRGQAAIEYVLMLIFSVSMLLALRGVFSQLDGFTKAYIGDYLECLMDYGELPSLGVSEAELKHHTSDGYRCNAKFQNFSLTGGRPLFSSSVGGGTSTTGGSNKKDDSTSSGGGRGSGTSGMANSRSSRSGSDDDSSSSSRSGRSGSGSSSGGDSSDLAGDGSGSGGSGSSRRRSSPYSSGQIQRNDSSGYGTADGAGAAGANSKVRAIGQNSESDDGGIFGGPDERGGRRGANGGKYRAITGAQAEEIEKNTGRAAKQPTSRRITADTQEGATESRRVALKRAEKKAETEIKESDSSFGFGSMLKWAIIAGMVIAIVVFFGGQVLNYSNSE